MAYQALYRKWRPKTFDEVVGQGHVVRTLKNEINSKKTAHAYLFCGTRGTGKTSLAKIFARAINCLNPINGNPCNECEICKGELNGGIIDITEIDAASNNGVDNIRQIRDEVMYSAVAAKYKIYIIDEVHMLSDGAFNALLKTLEEPPPHVVFILATTEAHELPATITSRCQRFDFKRILAKDIVIRLREICTAEKIKADVNALELIAHLADGALRDALSILDQCVCALPDGITLEGANEVLGIASNDALNDIVLAIAEHDSTKALMCIDNVVRSGRDLNNFIEMLIKRFRDILVLKVSSENKSELFSYGEETTMVIKKQCVHFDMETVSYVLNVLCEAQAKAKYAKSFRVIYELAFVKLCNRNLDTSNEALLQRMARLENMINSGNFAKVAYNEVKEVSAEVLERTAEKTQEKPIEKPVENVKEEIELPPWDIDENKKTPFASVVAVENEERAVEQAEKAEEKVKEEEKEDIKTSEKKEAGKPLFGSWADVLALMKKTSPPLHGALVCKKAKVADRSIYFVKDGYTKAIIQCMQEKFDDAVKTVFGEVLKIQYVKQSEFDMIAEVEAASNVEILRKRAEKALAEEAKEENKDNFASNEENTEEKVIEEVKNDKIDDFEENDAPDANIRDFSKIINPEKPKDESGMENPENGEEYEFEEDEVYAKPQEVSANSEGENEGSDDPLDELVSIAGETVEFL